MARPTKITKSLTDKIAKQIAKGVTPEIACQLHGVATTTYYRWIQQGKEQEKGLFREFWELITRAKVEMRANIEAELMASDPRFYATRSPLMRETAEVPGWHNFEKANNIQVNVVTVSSIVEDGLQQLPQSTNLLELPNMSDEDIEFIGENGHKNGYSKNTDKVG